MPDPPAFPHTHMVPNVFPHFTCFRNPDFTVYILVGNFGPAAMFTRRRGRVVGEMNAVLSRTWGPPEDQVALSSRWRLINCRRGRAEASRIQASSTTRINEVQMRPTGQICRRGADKRAGLARIVTLHVGGEGETRGQTAWVDARAVDEEVRIVCAGRE